MSSSKTPTTLQSSLKRGLTPTLNSINHLLTFLSQSQRFKLVAHFFFSQLASNRIRGNPRTHSTVARALLKLRDYDGAEQFMRTHFAETPNPHSARLWEALVRGHCAEANDPEKGLLVLRHCLRSRGTLPRSSSFVFCSLICGFSSRGDMGKAIEVLELMTEFGYPFGNFVCSLVMAGFCRIGEPEFAVSFFESAVSSGALKPNVVTYTALVGGLCRLGRIGQVRGLVCRMVKEGIEPDVVFYSSWICGYISKGLLTEVFKKSREMVGKGIVSDTISHTILVDGFSKLGYVEKSVGFLERMRSEGLEPNLITFTSIVLGFSRKRKMEEAFSVFEMVVDLGIEVDEFMYVALIDGFCRVGDFNRVFELLDDMERQGISPSLVTYNTLINGLCKFGRTTEADEFSKGLSGDSVTYSTLLHGYIQEKNITGILETKRRFESAGVNMDVVMSNVLIKALFMVGEIDEAYALYKGMQDKGLAANAVTFCTMIHECCKVGGVDEAMEVFDEFKRARIDSVACYNCLLTGLCNNKLVDMAVEVFIELNDRGLPLDVGICRVLIKSVIKQKGPEYITNLLYRLDNMSLDVYGTLCSSAINLLCKRCDPEAAFQVLTMMRTKGLTLTSKSYYRAMKALIVGGYKEPSWSLLNCFLKDYGLDESMVRKMLAFYMCLNDAEFSLSFVKKMKHGYGPTKLPRSLFKELVQSGRVLDVYKLLVKAEDNLPKMDVVDYTHIIHVLCKKGCITKALDLTCFAQEKGISLDIVTYSSVIGGLCSQGRIIEAFRVFDSLERLDLVPTEVTYAILVFALCREGFLLDAERLFKRMLRDGFEPNIRVYNSIIDGYCRTGKMDEAKKLLGDLEAKGLKPDGFTVSALINGCCYSGDMERALEYYSEFKSKDILPDFLGFKYLIRGLCSKGRMEESRSIIREMLQCPSVVKLINKVDTEGETETLESFLVSLCDQGSIKDAVSVLNEVASIFYPLRNRSSRLKESDLPNKPFESYGTQEKRMAKKSRFDYFENYYSRIASLCSKGEVERASQLAKELLPELE